MTANSDLIIYQENELYGLKDCNDNVIISPQYKEMYPFSCGLALVKNNKSQLGYINKENKNDGKQIYHGPFGCPGGNRHGGADLSAGAEVCAYGYILR